MKYNILPFLEEHYFKAKLCLASSRAQRKAAGLRQAWDPAAQIMVADHSYFKNNNECPKDIVCLSGSHALLGLRPTRKLWMTPNSPKNTGYYNEI